MYSLTNKKFCMAGEEAARILKCAGEWFTGTNKEPAMCGIYGGNFISS